MILKGVPGATGGVLGGGGAGIPTGGQTGLGNLDAAKAAKFGMKTKTTFKSNIKLNIRIFIFELHFRFITSCVFFFRYIFM